MKCNKNEKKIEKIKKKLLEIQEMRPGSLSKQYNVCGNPNCKCKDPDKPKKHGPYYQLSYVNKGKSTTRFIRAHQMADVKKQTKNFKKFKELMEEWISLSIEDAEEKLKTSRVIGPDHSAKNK